MTAIDQTQTTRIETKLDRCSKLIARATALATWQEARGIGSDSTLAELAEVRAERRELKTALDALTE